MLEALPFRLAFALWSLFLGVFLPYVPFPASTRLVNFFWASVYGVGAGVQDRVSGIGPLRPHLWLGLLLWPLFVSAVMFWIGGIVWRRRDQRRLGVAIMTASSLCLVTADAA